MVKKCLTKGEMTKVNKAVDKKKPATRKDQRLAGKQETFFDKKMGAGDKDFWEDMADYNKAERMTAVLLEFRRANIDISKSKITQLLNKKFKVKIPKIKKPRKIPTVKGLVFSKAKDQKIYDSYYNGFMKDSKLKTKKDFTAKWKKIVSKDIKESTSTWKFSTSRPEPSGLKMKAESIERGIETRTRLKRGYSPENKRLSVKFANKIKTQDYLETRALHQAYMDKNNIRKVTLYRGIGGQRGRQLVIEIKKAGRKSIIEIDQNSLVGYSSKREVGNTFGVNSGGATIRLRMKSTDIVLHDDLWWDIFGDVVDIMEDHGLDGLDNEGEFMCLGKRVIVKMKDIAIKGKLF